MPLQPSGTLGTPPSDYCKHTAADTQLRTRVSPYLLASLLPSHSGIFPRADLLGHMPVLRVTFRAAVFRSPQQLPHSHPHSCTPLTQSPRASKAKTLLQSLRPASSPPLSPGRAGGGDNKGRRGQQAVITGASGAPCPGSDGILWGCRCQSLPTSGLHGRVQAKT